MVLSVLSCQVPACRLFRTSSGKMAKSHDYLCICPGFSAQNSNLSTRSRLLCATVFLALLNTAAYICSDTY